MTDSHPARPARESTLHRLITSAELRGEGALDKVALGVNNFVGSMYVFVVVTLGIVVWLFAGNLVGFDRTPWPLLLVLLNLPQLSIMISLQVSANLAQKSMDARAEADHETLIAIHKLGQQQIEILNSQNEVLDLLRKSIAKERP